MQLNAQVSYQWGITARGGAGTYLYGRGTLLRPGLLLPTYGINGFYEHPLHRQLTLRISAGYNNRGTVSRGEAVTDSVTLSSLGSYKNRLRDHHATNDILFHYQLSKKKDGKNPFVQAGLRNDFYLFSNYSSTGKGGYFDNVHNYFYRSGNYRSLITGAVAAGGIRFQRYEIGLEYYYQLSPLLRYPHQSTVLFRKQQAHSISLTATYRFY